jgi:hypothetical protein
MTLIITEESYNKITDNAPLRYFNSPIIKWFNQYKISLFNIRSGYCDGCWGKLHIKITIPDYVSTIFLMTFDVETCGCEK